MKSDDAAPKTIYLKDYAPPDFLIDEVELRFELGEESTQVSSRITLRRNPAATSAAPALVLDGRELALKGLRLDGCPLGEEDFAVDDNSLTIAAVPDAFTLEVETEIKPQENTSLEGLYRSSGNFCTQCEPEGFRKITYFLDRPDVMARYTTTVVGDRASCPVLLSNGNLAEAGELDGGRHFTTWRDPHPKPCYLFALVAGDLVLKEDVFTTRSGREVGVKVFVEPRNADKCEHALRSMKDAMKWDEEVFGREYDLDAYMIVAVDDFNMGAMENKGLNVFNSKYVLAQPETATDDDYEHIRGVIGHEYFHNWSGNRVTCRDWFQLSLKEGFTVFRDQQFTGDMTSTAVKRISDVNVLRTFQFREDGGPLSHPVRPPSYVEINNFYTLTVYNKGAEVVRMIYRLLGPGRFRAGTDLYFQRHDGQAVTTDDFVKAMEEASGVDLTQFRRWYEQAGTPEVTVEGEHDAAAGRYTLTARQTCPPTPGQEQKQPFHLPLAVGLVGPDGADLPLQLEGEAAGSGTTRVLELREAEQRFVFKGVEAAPRPSLLRGFSAPVKLSFDYSDDDLAFLMARDSDAFNRWEAGQRLAIRVLQTLSAAWRRDQELHLAPGFVDAFRAVLQDQEADRRLVAQALALPGEEYLAELADEVEPAAIHEARQFVRRTLARELKPLLLDVKHANTDEGPYRVDRDAIGRRRLKNTCLSYLMELDEAELRQGCVEQFEHADNMTDVIAALAALANTACPERSRALQAFYEKWSADPLVVDKWFVLQATSRLPNTLEAVKALRFHPAFNVKNPNKVRALISAFAMGNPARFHDPSGAGYTFLADHVLEVDAFNPMIAARLAQPLSGWRRYEPGRRALMQAQLERIAAAAELSKNTYEIVTKSLG